MTEPTLWWILAGVAVAVELLTGTFYLLMLAIGLRPAVAAHAGAGVPVQLIVAAVVGGGAVAAWHLRRSRQPKWATGHRQPRREYGCGRIRTHRSAWNADGTATVKYRGANWTVVHIPGVIPGTGTHRVREVVGNRLVVEKI